MTRGEGETWSRDGSAAGLKAACEASMTALGATVIDVYQLHRHDPRETYADQIRAISDLRDLGWVREVGISNATLAELEVALESLGGPGEGGLVSVQNEFSPRFREDREVLRTLHRTRNSISSMVLHSVARTMRRLLVRNLVSFAVVAA